MSRFKSFQEKLPKKFFQKLEIRKINELSSEMLFDYDLKNLETLSQEYALQGKHFSESDLLYLLKKVIELMRGIENVFCNLGEIRSRMIKVYPSC